MGDGLCGEADIVWSFYRFSAHSGGFPLRPALRASPLRFLNLLVSWATRPRSSACGGSATLTGQFECFWLRGLYNTPPSSPFLFFFPSFRPFLFTPSTPRLLVGSRGASMLFYAWIRGGYGRLVLSGPVLRPVPFVPLLCQAPLCWFFDRGVTPVASLPSLFLFASTCVPLLLDSAPQYLA